MSILANLTVDDSINEAKDTVGGGGPLESGLYKATVTVAYVTQSSGGALGLVAHFKTEDNREFRQTFWMTSGTAKGCKNYYEKDGEKHYLPGFTHASHLGLLSVGKEMADMDLEEKVINLYSFEAKKEVPTKVNMVMDLINQEIIVGLLKQTVDKVQKDDNTGKYEPTGETRDENEVDKFFRAKDRMTVAEIRAQAEEASFIDTWEQKWSGKTRNRAKGASENTGTVGAPKANKKPSTSLFAA